MRHDEEKLEFSRGFRKVQMYAEFLMGSLSMIMILLYIDSKETHILPPSIQSITDICAFIMFLISTLFAGAKALYRITDSVKEIRTLVDDIIKYKTRKP